MLNFLTAVRPILTILWYFNQGRPTKKHQQINKNMNYLGLTGGWGGQALVVKTTSIFNCMLTLSSAELCMLGVI